MFENIGFGELLLIIIVLIVFFGPKKIPDIAQSIGKGIREFKRAMKDVQDEVTRSVNEVPKTTDQKQVTPPAQNQELKADSQSKTEIKS
ncbi:MAG TPA: twin-arginine translocase TatA/TatE family subunit [Candidatus Kryptonia bacterium]